MTRTFYLDLRHTRPRTERSYRNDLINPLILRFKQIDVPMVGLMKGPAASWLSEKIK